MKTKAFGEKLIKESLKNIKNEQQSTKLKMLTNYLKEYKTLVFEDNYKTIQNFDNGGKYSIILSYKKMKKYFCVKMTLNKNLKLIKEEFDNFNNIKETAKFLKDGILVKYKKIFIEKNSIKLKKIEIVKIFEDIEYILYNQYYIRKIDLREKHVLKHYEENEILKIFKDMIKMLKIFKSKNYKINFWNFFICYKNNTYKFFLNSVKSSNSIEIGNELKLAALLNYGLFKEVVGAYFNFNPQNIEKLIEINNKGKIEGFQRVIDLLVNVLIKENTNKKTISEDLINKNLEEFYQTLYLFKNQDIFLADQPIFKFIKKITFEIDEPVDDISRLMNFVGDKLNQNKELISLNLKFNNCALFNYNTIKILNAFKTIKKLQNLQLNFSENNLDDFFVDELVKNLDSSNLQIFDFVFNETRISENAFEKILSIISRSENLQLLNIEIMNKE
jgi:hypothetical protein